MKATTNKILIFASILVVGIFAIRFLLGGSEDSWICDKGQWIKHGNPSNPKPQTPCGEEVDNSSSNNGISRVPEDSNSCGAVLSKTLMNIDDARKIAEKMCKDGNLGEGHFCNSQTGTWWIDFTPDEPVKGCNPACVVTVESATAEINWRCTGLTEPNL